MDETEKVEALLDMVASRGWELIEDEALGEIEGIKESILFNTKSWEDVLLLRGRALALFDLVNLRANLSSEDVEDDDA